MGGGRTVEGEFLPENGVFWCILGLLFKIGQANGGRPPPWIRHWTWHSLVMCCLFSVLFIIIFLLNVCECVKLFANADVHWNFFFVISLQHVLWMLIYYNWISLGWQKYPRLPYYEKLGHCIQCLCQNFDRKCTNLVYTAQIAASIGTCVVKIWQKSSKVL